MTKSTKETLQEKTKDNTTLIENIESLELENKTLKGQLSTANKNIEENLSLISSLKETETYLSSQVEELKTALSSSEETLSRKEEEKTLENKRQAEENLRELNALTLKQQKTIEEKTKQIEELRNQLGFYAKEQKKLEKAYLLSPFTNALLTKLAEKLSEKYNKEITPNQIIEDYLIRYNIQKYSEWFHPFVLKENEIVEMAHSVNPMITSIAELKKALNLK